MLQVGSNFIGYQCAFMLANSLVFMLLFLLVGFFGVCTVRQPKPFLS